MRESLVITTMKAITNHSSAPIVNPSKVQSSLFSRGQSRKALKGDIVRECLRESVREKVSLAALTSYDAGGDEGSTTSQ